MNKNIIIVLCCLFFTNCSNTINKKERIIAKWRVVKVDLDVQKTKIDSVIDVNTVEKDYKISFDIRKNGTYFIKKGFHADSGKWSISTDERVLMFISDVNVKDNATFILENISKYDMILSVQENGKKETLTLNIDDK